MTNDQRFCRKCLLRDMEEDVYFKNMRDYIEHLDQSVKADEREYERRLLLCKECEKLLNGMCRSCGCFVEMRAAILTNHCPDVKRYW